MKAYDNSLLIKKVPTFGPTCAGNRQRLKIDGMNAEHVASLRKADPFMYYSISEILKAAVFSDANPSIIEDLLEDLASPAESESSKTSISRRTCISFEAHPSVLMEDLLNSET
mmetsp:Transcript_38155/g.81422  ORF Transcript_38155/g.81422 Transcript_38155/m.81422 type:complete len:113 (-) Transcript_38155:251-589(-)